MATTLPRDWVMKDDFMQWMVMHLITEFKLLKKGVVEPNAKGKGQVEVELKINGYEIDFIGAMKHLEEEYDHNVEERSAEIARELLGAITEPLEDAIREAVGLFKDKLGVEPAPDDWGPNS